MYNVEITFINGSKDASKRFHSFLGAQHWAREGISYSGGRVRRVEVRDTHGSLTALWDVSWDAVSKHAGLYS